MASLTLTRMAEGGIYDQLGGGFARYSVDGRWMIPHFEKLLYDNAQLLCEYSRASLATGEALFARIAGETADWVLRDLRAAQGGFYSSLDADSEGHEGRFYVWTRSDVQALLTAQEYAAFSRRFGLDLSGNFEGEWHLHAHESIDALASALGESPRSVEALIDAARAKLLRVRDLRVWPARDEKVLTAWNALMIKGLAIAARVLRRPDLAEAATAAVDFIRHRLWRDGRLLATTKDGRAHLPAYLDDYAFLADALLELLQTRWRSTDLEFARGLAEVLLAQFEDADAGGFFFTAADHERLIHRSKTFSDESLPSGNGVAAAGAVPVGVPAGRAALAGCRGANLEGGMGHARAISPGAYEPAQCAGGLPRRPANPHHSRRCARGRALGRTTGRPVRAHPHDIRHSPRCRIAAARARGQAGRRRHRRLCVHRHDLLRAAR